MQVIDDIINYLWSKGLITEESLEILKAKGYYTVGDNYDYFLDHDGYDEIEGDYYDDIFFKYRSEDEEALSLEKKSADNRRRKQGRKARFNGVKKRHSSKARKIIKDSLHKKMTYTSYDGFTFSEEVLDIVKELLPIEEKNKLYKLLYKHYEYCHLFWNDLARVIGEEQVIKYNDQLIEIFSKFNKIQEGNSDKLEKRFIQPALFFMLKKEELIYNINWRLVLKIGKNFIELTTYKGELKSKFWKP